MLRLVCILFPWILRNEVRSLGALGAEAGYRLEIERFAANHEIAQILQGSGTGSVGVQDHPLDDPTNPTLDSFLMRSDFPLISLKVNVE